MNNYIFLSRHYFKYYPVFDKNKITRPNFNPKLKTTQTSMNTFMNQYGAGVNPIYSQLQ